MTSLKRFSSSVCNIIGSRSGLIPLYPFDWRISATVTGNTLLKKNALIASLLIICKTSFRSSIIQDVGSCAQRLSKKFIQVHAAAVVPVPLERPAVHPHFA